MTWNKEKINEFLKSAERSETFVLLYNDTAKYYRHINLTISIITILGSYLLGSTGIFINLLEKDAVQIINLIIQVLIIVLGIISTIQKTISFADKVSNYESLSSRHSDLSRIIRAELGKENTKKQDFNEFYETIIATEVELKKDQLHVPDFIYNRYRKKMQDKALNYHEIFLTEIKVVDVSVSADKMKTFDKYI